MIIEWPTERNLCCHSAGSMTWDSNGNLYFAVGDNTNSGGDSAGMAPIDERTSRDPQYDAQRTSGNTNDLRGKINRIHPEANGTYTIPSGNLFAPGTAQTRPGDLRHGDAQPVPDLGRQAGRQHPLLGRGRAGRRRDPRQPRPGGLRRVQPRHQRGQLRLALLRRPERGLQRLGLRGQRAPRAGSRAAGRPDPVNNSPRNTGLQQLPPTRGALVWEQHGGSKEWPALDQPGGCGSPNHAEVYHYNPNLNSAVKWPQYYDNKLIITEYCRNWIKEVQFGNGNPATGNPTIIEPVLAGMPFVHPIDMEFGPDGSLYLLEYGSGYFSGAADAALVKINYVQGGRSPVAVATASVDNGLTR